MDEIKPDTEWSGELIAVLWRREMMYPSVSHGGTEEPHRGNNQVTFHNVL